MRDPNLIHWNEQLKNLRTALKHPSDTPEWRELFLELHAAVHRKEVSCSSSWSRADEVLSGLENESLKRIPENGEHSIAWVLWHLARIEDVTMNVLLAGQEQLFLADNWREQFAAVPQDTGNGSTLEEVKKFSAEVPVEPLLEYRNAVGRSTRIVLLSFPSDRLCERVAPDRLQRLADEGAVTEAGKGALEYWGSLTLASLLLMPPTRHCFLHLNEILQIRRKLHL